MRIMHAGPHAGIARCVRLIVPTSGPAAVTLAVPAANAAQVDTYSATALAQGRDAALEAGTAWHIDKATNTLLVVTAGSSDIALILEATD